MADIRELLGPPRRPPVRRKPRNQLPWQELRLVLTVGAAFGFAAPYALERSTASTSAGSAALVRVVDGDTFWYGGDKIRIADIDTPEVRGRCPEERAMAARATDRLRSLLAENNFELEQSGRDEDRYGRKLRIVTRDGRSIGDMLVAEGLAREWTGRREPWCA